MDIKKISEKNNVTRLLIKGADITLLNSIRRTIMNSVPTLAIENVSIHENTSIMPDEFLAHRLGLLPIKTDLKSYKEGDKVTLTAEKEGPGMVYSSDIKPKEPKTGIVSEKIPIVKLAKGQKIKIEAEAVIGTGKKHSKWQPAVVSYNEVPKITIGSECNECRQCIKNCPVELLELKADKVVLKDPLNCILCGKCRDSCPKNCLTLDYANDSFVMTIENHGNLTTDQIFEKAVDAIAGKTKEFKNELKNIA